ncbi:unnamed protein product [Caenorhabditis angaria]|uniref:Uncharacterized protein n=1 Tax=Caenorhabditis angaria TaxID=860376 RepID=A0A9P1IDS4_9PELO|nr:unnamed protein product [Caenorhabditis angaria]
MGQEQSQTRISQNQPVSGQNSKPNLSTSAPAPIPSKIQQSSSSTSQQSTWWNWNPLSSSSSSSSAQIKPSEVKKKDDSVYEPVPSFSTKLPPPPPTLK